MYRYDEFDNKLVINRVKQFTKQIKRRINGELTEDEFKPLRLMNGLYLQLHAYMLRVAIPYGELSSKQLKSIKPKIYSVFKGLESENILKIKDVILKIGKFKINNVYDVFKAKNKQKWNSTVDIIVKRNTKILNLKIRIKSFNNWKKKHPRIGLHAEKKDSNIVISSTNVMSSVSPTAGFGTRPKLDIGDRLISINEEKITKLDDFFHSIQNMVPGVIVNFKFLRDGILLEEDIKIISVGDFIKINRKFCKQYWPKTVSSLLVKEYEENDFYLDEKYKHKILSNEWKNKKESKRTIRAVNREIKNRYKEDLN